MCAGIALCLILPGAAHADDLSVDQGFAAGVAAAKRSPVYVVQMSDDPVVAYRGGNGRLKRTRPGDGDKINPNSRAVRAYAAHLDATHDAALAEVGGGTKIYDYHYSFNGFAAVLTADLVPFLFWQSLVGSIAGGPPRRDVVVFPRGCTAGIPGATPPLFGGFPDRRPFHSGLSRFGCPTGRCWPRRGRVSGSGSDAQGISQRIPVAADRLFGLGPLGRGRLLPRPGRSHGLRRGLRLRLRGVGGGLRAQRVGQGVPGVEGGVVGHDVLSSREPE